MTKNIIVLLKLLEHGEVSTNDFAGIEKGNIRHLPRIINDARKHVDIYSEEIRDATTTEILGMKYILMNDEKKWLMGLIHRKADTQLEKKQIGALEHSYLKRRLKNESRK